MGAFSTDDLTFTQVTGAGTLTGIESSAPLTGTCFFRQEGKLVKAEPGQRLVRFPSGKIVVLSEADYDAAFVVV